MGGTLKKYELQERKSEDPYHCTDLVYNNEEKKKYIIKYKTFLLIFLFLSLWKFINSLKLEFS